MAQPPALFVRDVCAMQLQVRAVVRRVRRAMNLLDRPALPVPPILTLWAATVVVWLVLPALVATRPQDNASFKAKILIQQQQTHPRLRYL
jgi:hypothetical protein